jgi:pimeloyl-ACP methyl ester carboxylesterase
VFAPTSAAIGVSFTFFDYAGQLRLGVETSPQDAQRLLQRRHHRTPLYMPAFAAGLRAALQRKAVLEMLQSATQNDLPAAERLPELAVPTLLLWGRSERLLPPSSLAYFRKHLPKHALIEEPEGFGHCPHIDDPRRLTQRVIAFMSENCRHTR